MNSFELIIHIVFVAGIKQFGSRTISFHYVLAPDFFKNIFCLLARTLCVTFLLSIGPLDQGWGQFKLGQHSLSYIIRLVLI